MKVVREWHIEGLYDPQCAIHGLQRDQLAARAAFTKGVIMSAVILVGPV
jgi:hypothetical protein